MPIDLITLSAAFLSGAIGSVHCVLMCGGIATGFGAATAIPAGGRAALVHAFELNAGRVAGYVAAGAVVGALGGGLLRVVDSHSVQLVMRTALGVAMMLIGLQLAGVRDRWNLVTRAGAPIWRALAPLRGRLLPADTLARRLAMGMLWGWLPCGLSSALLVVAWLEADAWHGALVMASFGAGTLPAMVPLTWSGYRTSGRAARAGGRRAAAAFVLVAGLVTAVAPWATHDPTVHRVLVTLGCRSA